MLVDVHAHYAPRVFVDALERMGTGRQVAMARHPNMDEPGHLEARLEMMDQAGVRKQVLSPNGMVPYSQDAVAAAEAARIGNDSYADLVARYPDRFASFVSLPLPHVDASLKEMARGLDDLGMVGVHLSCSVFNRSTAESEFEPLYEEMNRRGSILFFHPVQNGICSPLINDYKFTVSVGASMEDTAIGLHLVARQIPRKYPNIKIIIPHLGGLLPMQLERLDNQASPMYPEWTERPGVTLRRFYYDTVGHGSQAGLLAAWKAFGADHLVTGSDWPVLLAFESYARTFDYIRESDLPAADIEQIIEKTAPALFGWPA